MHHFLLLQHYGALLISGSYLTFFNNKLYSCGGCADMNEWKWGNDAPKVPRWGRTGALRLIIFTHGLKGSVIEFDDSRNNREYYQLYPLKFLLNVSMKNPDFISDK